MSDNFKQIATASSVVVGLLVFALALTIARPTDAATFLIRGDVMKIDKPNGTVNVYIRHTNSVAEHYAGQTREINVNNADFFKYDEKQRKVRSTYGSTLDNLGYEVVIRGTVNDSETFTGSWLVRNDNTVRLRGTVRGHNQSLNYLDVDLDKIQYQATKKNYKASQYPKDTQVRIYYSGNESTKFINRDGKAMNEDEVLNDDEPITVENIDIRYGGRFVGERTTTITDNKWKF